MCLFCGSAERRRGGSRLLPRSLVFQPLLPAIPGRVPGAPSEWWGPYGCPLVQRPCLVPAAMSLFPANVKSAEQMEKKKERKKKKPNKHQPNNMRKKCWCVLGGLVETPRWIPPKGGARAGSRPPAGLAAFFLDSLTIWGLNFCLKNMYF